MTATLAELDDVFHALAEPNRRIVLERLAATGEGTATTLAAGLPFSRQAVVKHLIRLDRAHLVRSQRAGREVRYTVCSERLAAAGRDLEAIAAGWDRTLIALKKIAESTAP